MILYNNIVKISKNRRIGYMLKVALLLASSVKYLADILTYKTVYKLPFTRKF